MRLHYSFYFFILLLGFLCLQSCQKDLFVPSGDKDNPDILARAQAWVESNSPKESSLRNNLSTLDYQWDQYALSKNSKGDDVVTVPITSAPGKKEYLELAFVVAQVGEVGVIKQYEGDLEKWEHVILNMYNAEGRRFISGVYSTKTKLLTVTSALTSKFSKLEKIASTSASGNSSSETPPDGSIENPFPIDGVDVPPPGGGGTNPPSGGGGGITVPVNPGGGSTTPPAQTPKQLKTSVLNTRKRTDCDAIALAKSLAARSDYQSAVNEIKNKTLEYFAPFKFSNPENASSTSVGATRTDGKKNSVNPNQSWDSSNGYHHGGMHNHPSNSAPSPSDIYIAMLSLNQMVNNDNISQNQFVNYIDNFASVVVSGGYVYTISIKNALFSNLMKGGFNNTKEKILYEKNIKEYFKDANFVDEPSVEDYQTAGEYALLRRYGDDVHITKHKIGEPNNVEIIKRDGTKKVKKVKPGC